MVAEKDRHDGLQRILTTINKLRKELSNCPWDDIKLVRINVETEERLQEWYDIVRKEFMLIDLGSFERVVSAIFGVFLLSSIMVMQLPVKERSPGSSPRGAARRVQPVLGEKQVRLLSGGMPSVVTVEHAP